MLEKIKDSKNLPIILFIIILLNLIPLAIPNMISKQSHAAGTPQMLIAFGIQCVLLIYFMHDKIEFTKEIRNNLILLCIVTSVLLLVQIKNLIFKDALLMDFGNIIIKFINILLLYIAMLNIKTKENSIIIFMKAIVYLGVIASLFNIIFYNRELINLISSKNINFTGVFKSFFAHRNQFSCYLYIAIANNIFVLLKEKKLIYKLTLIFMICSLFLGMSRTAMLVTFIFLALCLITTDKIKWLFKLGIAMFMIILLISAFLIMNKIAPNATQGFIRAYIRPQTISTLTGRTQMWNIGLESLKNNYMVGIGRFKGIQLIKNARIAIYTIS